MQLCPYLFFDGTCEEALEFYKSALGGTYEINRFEGSPAAAEMPADYRKKVMHRRLRSVRVLSWHRTAEANPKARAAIRSRFRSRPKTVNAFE